MNRYLLRAALFVSINASLLTGCANQTLSSPQKAMQTQALAFENDNETPAPVFPRAPSINTKFIALTQFNMNNQGKEIRIKPGKLVQASLHYQLHCPHCPTENNQILIGLAKRSAQTCIYNGSANAEGTIDFTLKMPAKPGKYEVRFRGLQAENCDQALKIGWHDDGSSSKETTIGMVIVSKKVIENPV